MGDQNAEDQQPHNQPKSIDAWDQLDQIFAPIHEQTSDLMKMADEINEMLRNRSKQKEGE